MNQTYQSFEVMAGLKHRFMEIYMHMYVFNCKTSIITTLNVFTMFQPGTEGCYRFINLLSFFITTHFFFQDSCLSCLTYVYVPLNIPKYPVSVINRSF